MPAALRKLFVTILVYSSPIGVRTLWDEFSYYMVEGYASSNDIENRNKLLRDLNMILQQFSKDIRDFDLPEMTDEPEENIGISR